MTSYQGNIPQYLREHTGRNAREWERRLRKWCRNYGSLPTHHWTQVAQGKSKLGIWTLWRVQEKDLQLTTRDWMNEPAMHVMTKRTSTHSTEIEATGFIKINPLSIPAKDLTEISVEARKKDLRERQRQLTDEFDRETTQHINRLYAECVRKHVRSSLRDGDLTLLRGKLCVPSVRPPSNYQHQLVDFQKKMVRQADIRKRTAKDIVESVNRDMWWPQYRMVDDERNLPSLYLAEIDLVNDWELGFY